MWKRLHNSLPYYLLFTHQKTIDIKITNYVKIWTVHYNVDEFVSCLKEKNFALEIDANEIFTNGIEMLSQPEHLKTVDVMFEQEHLKVSLSRNFGYPLKLVMILNLGSNDIFYKMVTQTLLRTIQDLRNSETELRNLLKCKDKEIEEYKAEAGDICLRYLKTKPFNDGAHMEKHTMFDINFASSDISETLLEEPVDSPKGKNIKQEIVEQIHIKTEPATQVVQMEMQVIPDNIKAEFIKTEPSIAPKKRKIKLNI